MLWTESRVVFLWRRQRAIYAVHVTLVVHVTILLCLSRNSARLRKNRSSSTRRRNTTEMINRTRQDGEPCIQIGDINMAG